MGVGTITATYTRSEVANFSWPYREDKFGMIGHQPRLLPKWQAIFWPFQLEVWLAIGMSIVLFPPILLVFVKTSERYQIHGKSRFSLFYCFWSSMQSICSEGY